jgi:hypothetical protein
MMHGAYDVKLAYLFNSAVFEHLSVTVRDEFLKYFIFRCYFLRS